MTAGVGKYNDEKRMAMELFGEDIQRRMVEWLNSKGRIDKCHDGVAELGCGNGSLLLELCKCGFAHLTGVDFSIDAFQLAQSVLHSGGFDDVHLEVADITCDRSLLAGDSCLLRKYSVCIDKGTYDAISMAKDDPGCKRLMYRSCVKRLLQPNGLLLIASCNWTKEEMISQFEEGKKRLVGKCFFRQQARAYHQPLLFRHWNNNCEPITPTTMCKKWGKKTSSGGQERYIVKPKVELTCRNPQNGG